MHCEKNISRLVRWESEPDVMKDRYEEPEEEKGGSSNYFAMLRVKGTEKNTQS